MGLSPSVFGLATHLLQELGKSFLCPMLALLASGVMN